ncbi:MAG: BCD family MFS transporter [Steroidobacteraceae bacterium]|jgi:BCD family chlorophyll transporter-like MFS transporter|nr:BCD family MFS transporter [Steroidobacteraceae bacterium]
MKDSSLGWLGIFRLGLVQAAIGGIVVMTTSTLNRVMVVELSMPAMLPGMLVALHYFVQVLRPRLGYGSDLGGRRAPWIVGGMALLGIGATGAAASTALMASAPLLGIAAAVVAFTIVGLGVGACGTALLVLISKRVDQGRLAAAATVTWLMMIVGFILTTVVVGKMLEPFSLSRMVEVAATVSAGALLLTAVAVYNVEGARPAAPAKGASEPAAANEPRFREALMQVWSEPHSRRLASFVFVSMLAYSAQDLILEPFAGTVFGMTPAESTRLSGVQNAGVLIGMALVALFCTFGTRTRVGALRTWTVIGCVASATMLCLLAVGSFFGAEWPLRESVFCLGLANGVFAVAAIGSMMRLVGAGRQSREGVRMGLWGAAQAVAFGLGGIVGTLAVDAARLLLGSPTAAYALVFVAEAVMFVIATGIAVRLSRTDSEVAGFEPAAVAVPEGRYATQAGG